MKPSLPFLILLLLLFMSGTASAQYYADVDIYVDEKGVVRFTGNTNYVLFVDSDQYTSYDSASGTWLLNITSSKEFDSYFFTLHLPEESSVLYIKTGTLSRIDATRSDLQLIGYGSDRPFELVVQYRTKPYFAITPILLTTLGVLLVAIGAYVYRLRRLRLRLDLIGLPNRQKKVLRYLKKQGGKCTQAQLERALGLPKSSLSRNIAALERRGLIKKEGSGMTNTIRLN